MLYFVKTELPVLTDLNWKYSFLYTFSENRQHAGKWEAAKCEKKKNKERNYGRQYGWVEKIGCWLVSYMRQTNNMNDWNEWLTKDTGLSKLLRSQIATCDWIKHKNKNVEKTLNTKETSVYENTSQNTEKQIPLCKLDFTVIYKHELAKIKYCLWPVFLESGCCATWCRDWRSPYAC